MAGRGGHRDNAGRKPGVPTKQTVAVKQAFIDAFDKMGGVLSLVKWGKANETEFYKLYSKLIPQDITSNGESLFEVLIGSNGQDKNS